MPTVTDRYTPIPKRPTGGVAKAERALLRRLTHDAPEEDPEKQGGAPQLRFRPAIQVVTAPPRCRAVPAGDDWIAVQDLGFGDDIGERIDERSMDGALSSFVDLWNADAATVAGFVDRFGSLRFCPCGELLGDGFAPSSHRFAVTQRPGLYIDKGTMADVGWLSDSQVEHWVAGGHSEQDRAHRRREATELKAHAAPRSVVGLAGVTTRQVFAGTRLPTSRFAHLDDVPGHVRFESVASWRAEARKVRALVVLAAFAKVALEVGGLHAITDPADVPGCRRGKIPFAPLGWVGAHELLRDASAWHAHADSALPPETILEGIAGETARRLKAERCYMSTKLDRSDWRFRAGVTTQSLGAFLSLALAGIASDAIGRGACQAPGCGRPLSGRRSVICGDDPCKFWRAAERTRRSRLRSKARAKGGARSKPRSQARSQRDSLP